MKIAKLQGKWTSNSFGHQSVHVMDGSGQEVFKIRRSKNVWNPLQWRTSFRILPPGSKDNDDALYTVNKDVWGKGFMWIKQEWKIYQGRVRDGKMLYYCVGGYRGWDFKIYRNPEEYKAHAKPIAVIKQKLNMGAFVDHDWIPDKFTLTVYEGGDSALLLAISSIIDITHDSNNNGNGMSIDD
eukprot:gb/GFBE01061880.1/.p1 GENE.gb/GFBE01061880.1/~~gb/GFBE01061880.1/.p1  ORF type:complete len:183 (+),score=42.79 gb/GFBE01061880.1/:1-549(+)